MVYVIVYTRNNRRVPKTPAFEYPQQGFSYINKKLGSSPYITVKKVGRNTRS